MPASSLRGTTRPPNDEGGAAAWWTNNLAPREAWLIAGSLIEDRKHPAEHAADVLWHEGSITTEQWLDITRPHVLARIDELLDRVTEPIPRRAA